MARNRVWILLCVAWLWEPGTLRAEEEIPPLFASAETLEVELRVPLKDLLADRRKEERSFRPSEIHVNGQVVPVGVKVSGNSRLSSCKAPPVQLRFEPGDAVHSPFEGQRVLFMTTHCQRKTRYQRYVVLEYLSYSIFNQITPLSYRVRLARVNYRDLHSSRQLERLAFFTEHPDSMTARNGLQPLQVDQVDRSELDAEQAARVQLFQYLVGNTDWSMLQSTSGRECCHNMQLATAPGRAVVPVPYDFDSAGLVDAPYAVPGDQFRMRSVRQRRYRGFCDHTPELPAVIDQFQRARPAIEALFRGHPELPEKFQKRNLKYIADFYETVADPERTQQLILDRCY